MTTDALTATRRLDERIMARHGWSAHPYAPEDQPGMLALLRSEYTDPDILSDAFFRWQFLDNPAGEAVIWLAKRGGQIIGQYLVIPQRLVVAGREVLGGLSAFTLTHESCRGQGIFVLLAQRTYETCRERGLQWVYGFPNPRSHTGFVRHLGFTELGRLTLYVAPRHIGRILEVRFASRPPHWYSGAINGIDGAVLAPLEAWQQLRWVARGAGWETAVTSRCDGRFDELHARLLRSHRAHCFIARTSAYLTWRFVQHPTRRYVVVELRRRGTLVGGMVLRVADVRGLRAGVIVDWWTETLAPRGAALRVLTAEAVRYFKQRAVDLVACVAPRPSLPPGAMLRRGWWAAPAAWEWQPQRVIVKALEPTDGAAPPPMEQWYLTFGDQDIL